MDRSYNKYQVKLLSLGWTESDVNNYIFEWAEDRILIKGDRRLVVAYEKGKFFTPEEAKMNATRVSKAERKPYEN